MGRKKICRAARNRNRYAERVVEYKKSGVSLTELRSGSVGARLSAVRTKIVRALVELWSWGRRDRSSSGNLDLQRFEDPNENFVQLINSVPYSLARFSLSS